MTTISSTFPTEASAGLNFRAALDLPGYPAQAWTVQAVIRGPAVIDLTAAGSGTVHTFDVPAATTASWKPGIYWYSLRAGNATDVFELATGQLHVRADLSQAAAGYDGRSPNEVALAAINAVLSRRATMDQERYTINNRELWRTPIPDLLKLKAHYTVLVRRERARAAGRSGLGRTVPVRFK